MWAFIKKGLRFIGALLLFLIVGAFLVYFKSDKSTEYLASRFSYPESQYLDWHGGTLHYRSTGEGPAIILLHGTGSSLHTWQTWTTILEKQYRVVSLDLPGYGLTGPLIQGNYNADTYASAITALANALEIDTFCLAGNSLGGGISWYYATQFPERVKKLVLVSPGGIIRDTIRKPAVFRLTQNKILTPIVRWITPRFFVEESLLDVYADPRKVTDTLVDRYYDLQLHEGNRQAFIDRIRTDFFENGRPSLKDVQAPTLIMWGEHDTWIPPSFGPLFQDSIPESRLITYPTAGHVPMEEIPYQTAKDALEFLKE